MGSTNKIMDPVDPDPQFYLAIKSNKIVYS